MMDTSKLELIVLIIGLIILFVLTIIQGFNPGIVDPATNPAIYWSN